MKKAFFFFFIVAFALANSENSASGANLGTESQNLTPNSAKSANLGANSLNFAANSQNERERE